MMLLRELTSKKHKQAETMSFNLRMLRGEISKKEYLHYLHQQASIFQILEQKGVPHPSLLRLQKIFRDIEELMGDFPEGLPSLKSTEKYCIYLQKLNDEEILPHIYLHYLALIYGGQIFKPKVYGKGRMYEFDNIEDAAQSIRVLQSNDWADEVNKAFDFMIDIYDELDRIYIKHTK